MHNPVSDTAFSAQQTILDDLPVAIIVVDKHASIQYSNPQAAALFSELSPEQINLTQLSSAFTEQDFLKAISSLNKKPAQIFASPFEKTLSFDRCQLPGLYHLKMVTTLENKKSQNNCLYLITLNHVNNDPSEISNEPRKYTLLKKNFKELKQFSRLNAMREISSSMADQLNQPLTAILSYTQAMQRLYQSNASLEEISVAMDRVVINAEHAGQVIRDIRAQLDANSLSCQNASINQLIQESTHLTELDNPASQINLITNFEPLNTTLCVGTIQFKQVILSLLNNAIDAVTDGSIETPEITLSTQINGPYYEITIEDNGLGIPPEIQDNLFNPFMTTKENGIGIGLSMCHHIIELHKGSITIDSEPKGTKVTICLPIKNH